MTWVPHRPRLLTSLLVICFGAWLAVAAVFTVVWAMRGMDP